MKLYRQLAVRPFNLADSQRLVFLIVKSFGEVNHHGQHTEWGKGLVETLGYIMFKRAETLGWKPCWMG